MPESDSERSHPSRSQQTDSRELGTECDVASCDERVVGLNDGWEYNRGVVCSSCIKFRKRHHHWPDENVETCRECILDDGGVVHDCPETTIDVLLRPGDNCPHCEFELAATDGGQQTGDAGRKGGISTLLDNDLTKYETDGHEYYVLQAGNSPELFRRVGETTLPRVMAAHDAVIIGGSFREVEFDGALFGVYHPFAGKYKTLTAQDTDDHAVLLERITTGNRLISVGGDT